MFLSARFSYWNPCVAGSRADVVHDERPQWLPGPSSINLSIEAGG
jgi:hypothetical protein